MSLLLHPNSQKIFNDLSVNPPQGLLILGASGTNKTKILNALANIYADGNSAGRIYYLEPVDDQKSVSIDQVRQLKLMLRLKSAKKRVVIVPDVSSLSTEAQNSILKILEEPGANVHFLMAASSSKDILPTIKSRVYVWQLTKPTDIQLAEYFSQYPKERLAKALAIGQGRIDLIEAVLLGEDTHPLLQSIQLSKDILAENHFERLCRVDVLSKNKQQTADLLDGLEIVCKAALEHVALLDLRKIPASPELPESSRTSFSDVNVPTGTSPPDKRTSESVLDSSGKNEVLRKSSVTNNKKQLSDWLNRLVIVTKTKQNLTLNVQPKLLLTQLFIVL